MTPGSDEMLVDQSVMHQSSEPSLVGAGCNGDIAGLKFRD